MQEKPNYYAILPANVRYDKKLKDKAKLLYGEITALSNKTGYCYANNKYFADLYEVSKMTISQLIKNLADCGYIETKIIYKEGTKEIKDRYIKILIYPYIENSIYPIYENLKDININTNNININNIYTIVDYLNLKLNTKYGKNSNKTKSLINARLNEGFTVEDFKIVIDKKCNEWSGTDMEKYLRPETLFGTKFEGYLNQKEKQKSNVPEWFGKEIKGNSTEMTKEERELYEELTRNHKEIRTN